MTKGDLAKMVFLYQSFLVILGAMVSLLVAYVYTVSPFVVWGLLLFCGVCHLLGQRAKRLFGATQTVRVPVSAPRRETRHRFALSEPIVCAAKVP
ncbi:MAG: hypothetical protein H7Y38_08600 [Armatimonadetes bacterium]|nr:hypothetical protein [Armatimonadota bacterium]